MQYNSTLFGAKTPLYSDQAHSNYCFDCGSINISQQSGYTSTAFTMGQNLPDDLFYWQIPADSPYSARSYLTRRGSSGSYTYNKYDSEKGEENVPIVLVAGKPKRNAQYNFDPSGSYDGNVSMHAYGFNTVSESVLKETNNSNPLWYHTSQLPSTQPSQGYWNGYPWILDFDYNNIIVEILVSVNSGSATMPLATYIENNNTAANKINWIGIQIYAGDKSTKASTNAREIIRSAKYNENGTKLINAGICVPILTDYHYTLPDFVKDSTNYSSDYYTTLRGFSSGNDSTMLFSGSVSTTSGQFYNSYLLEEDRWECTGGETTYTLIKHGTDGKYADTDFDYIRKLVAYLGFWFTDSDNAISVLLGENALEYDENEVPEGVYQAVIEDGVTTGEFIPLKVARNNDQSKWGKDWREKDGYNGRTSGGDKRPKPTPDKKGITLQTPGFSLAVDNGSVCYTITKADWIRIWNDIYGGSKKQWTNLIEGLALYGSNPLNAILNYRWYPFALGGTSTQPLRLGATVVKPSTHEYTYITSTSEAVTTSLVAEFWWGEDLNFINTRKTKCRIFLPFYGYYELPMTKVMSSVVGIQFQYNLPDDTGLWAIYFDGHIYDYLECTPFIEIPITGDNSLQIAAAKAQRNLSIAATVGAAAVGTAVAVGTLGAGSIIPWISEYALEGFGVGSAIAGMFGDIGVAGALGTLGATAGMAAPALAGGIKAANTVMQSALQIGNLSTNVPIHSAGSDSTFLQLTMVPYIEFFINDTQVTYNEIQYKLKVGIACDIWDTVSNMPSGSLLQTTGTANMDVTGMDLAEVTELNQILQSGFYK